MSDLALNTPESPETTSLTGSIHLDQLLRENPGIVEPVRLYLAACFAYHNDVRWKPESELRVDRMKKLHRTKSVLRTEYGVTEEGLAYLRENRDSIHFQLSIRF